MRDQEKSTYYNGLDKSCCSSGHESGSASTSGEIRRGGDADHNQQHRRLALSHRLRRRLLGFVNRLGARNANFKLSDAGPVLNGLDSAGQPFLMVIRGPARAWHEALDRLATEPVAEPLDAGMRRYLRHEPTLNAAAESNHLGDVPGDGRHLVVASEVRRLGYLRTSPPIPQYGGAVGGAC
jgi:hypothetical protein